VLKTLIKDLIEGFLILPRSIREGPPHNSLVVKSLFGGRLPLSPMAQQPWVTNAFKPLDMSTIQGYPHAMPQKFDKWLPKFLVIMSSLLKNI
jgi:hypothetical protein